MDGRQQTKAEPEGRGIPVEPVDCWAMAERRELGAMVEPLGRRNWFDENSVAPYGYGSLVASGLSFPSSVGLNSTQQGDGWLCSGSRIDALQLSPVVSGRSTG